MKNGYLKSVFVLSFSSLNSLDIDETTMLAPLTQSLDSL